ncbi:COMM domain-containing protein 5 isoform X1 [Drosophila miranda]|uniref:COMM domain-containing protein 5 isoform X1 n=1 Tax=Drosophila miranda TaxID=7229 RepID=UPI0007E658E9|nr:COMM domain-containing protein 5 isoform X1 [Drosophila miranda]XP_017153276.1 COMM domain-containing protein 5 isoform X1 [Drosophila miranda]
MTFSFRHNIQRNVQPYSSILPQLSKPMLRVLIQVSVHYIETKKSCSEVLSLAKSKLTNAGHEVPGDFCELFTIVFLMMQIFLRYPKGVVKADELRKCLMVDLRFSEECVEDICTVIFHHREILSKNYSDTKLDRVKMLNVKWRINISLTLSTIQDKTTVVLHFKLPSGDFRTLELPLSTFQRLRYSITLLLNDLQHFQSR